MVSVPCSVDGGQKRVDAVWQHDAALAATGRPAMDETSTRAIVNEERVVEIRGITLECAQSNTTRPAAGFREMQHAPALTGQGRKHSR